MILVDGPIVGRVAVNQLIMWTLRVGGEVRGSCLGKIAVDHNHVHTVPYVSMRRAQFFRRAALDSLIGSAASSGPAGISGSRRGARGCGSYALTFSAPSTTIDISVHRDRQASNGP
jgi:hypothetical protein